MKAGWPEPGITVGFPRIPLRCIRATQCMSLTNIINTYASGPVHMVGAGSHRVNDYLFILPQVPVPGSNHSRTVRGELVPGNQR